MNLNPFSDLEGFQLKDVMSQFQEKRQAEKSLQILAGAYREILTDQRYVAIREELSGILAQQLKLLVSEASGCSKCCKRAERVRLIHEIIHRPIEEVWYQNTLARDQESTNAGDG